MSRHVILLTALSIGLAGCTAGAPTTSGTPNAPAALGAGPHQIIPGVVVPPQGLDLTAGFLVVPTDLDGRYIMTADGRSLAMTTDQSGRFALGLDVATGSLFRFSAVLKGNLGLSALHLTGDSSTASITPASTLVAQLATEWRNAGNTLNPPDAIQLADLEARTETLLASGSLSGLDWTLGASRANANRYAAALANAAPALGAGWGRVLGEFSVLTTIGGNYGVGTTGLVDGVATAMPLVYPAGIASHGGKLYVAVSALRQIVELDGTHLTVLAGKANTDQSVMQSDLGTDSVACLEVNLPPPAGLTVDEYGNVFFTMVDDPRIGVLYLNATPDHGYFGIPMQPGQVYPLGESFDYRDASASSCVDGSIAQARFNLANDLVADQGYLYVADTRNNRIRRIAPDGTVSTIAGNSHVTAGTWVNYNGDSSAATDTWLARPWALALRSLSGGVQELFFIDTDNNRIRALRSTNHFTTATVRSLVGDNPRGAAVDGALASAVVDLGSAQNVGLALDSTGSTLFFTDVGNHRVRAIDLSAATVRTVAGGGSEKRDGLAAWTHLNAPGGLAILGNDLAITDYTANAVRLSRRFAAP